MSKRTKRDLEAEVEALKVRVAEQSAVIERLVAAPYAPAYPQYIPYPVPQPCNRPHYDGWQVVPYIPYVPTYPVWPQYPTQPFGPYWGGTVVQNEPVRGGQSAVNGQMYFNNANLLPGANAGCAAPMLHNVWVGETTHFAVNGSAYS